MKFVFPFLMLFPLFAVANEEGIFDEAAKYTVRIRTAVKYPLEADGKGTSQGAGFIIDKSKGWIATNAHVVSRSPSNNEVSAKGKEFIASKKIYVDDFIDFAIIQVNPKYLDDNIEAKVHCSDNIGLGHPVGAFGHPNSYNYTGTKGIISNKGTNKLDFELMQTDAPINPGNSGGPLISLKDGVVIGMNTSTLNNAQNSNFAIKAKYFCKIVDLLKQDKNPNPPYQDMVFFKDIEQQGILKVAVNNGSFKDLKEQDEIIEVNGVRVSNETEFFHELRGNMRNVKLKVKNNNTEKIITGSLQTQKNVVEREGLQISGATFSPLFYVRNINEVGLGSREEGIVVTNVEEGSLAEMSLFTKGILYKVDGKKVKNIQELFSMAKSVEGKTEVLHIVLKQFGGNRNLFSYIEYNLPVDKIDKIVF